MWKFKITFQKRIKIDIEKNIEREEGEQTSDRKEVVQRNMVNEETSRSMEEDGS